MGVQEHRCARYSRQLVCYGVALPFCCCARLECIGRIRFGGVSPGPTECDGHGRRESHATPNVWSRGASAGLSRRKRRPRGQRGAALRAGGARPARGAARRPSATCGFPGRVPSAGRAGAGPGHPASQSGDVLARGGAPSPALGERGRIREGASCERRPMRERGPRTRRGRAPRWRDAAPGGSLRAPSAYRAEVTPALGELGNSTPSTGSAGACSSASTRTSTTSRTNRLAGAPASHSWLLPPTEAERSSPLIS